MAGFIDTRASSTLKDFDGRDESWGMWSFVAYGYFTILTDASEMASDQADNCPIGSLVSMGLGIIGDDARALNKTLFHILV